LSTAIRTDNGVPFATQAIHGLSYLNVWWMRLGIPYQRSRPGCPRDNGAHERMHRTLKRQAIKPVRANCSAQQRNLDAFQQEYNVGRQQERLNQLTPASHYHSSPRAYPERLAGARRRVIMPTEGGGQYCTDSLGWSTAIYCFIVGQPSDFATLIWRLHQAFCCHAGLLRDCLARNLRSWATPILNAALEYGTEL